MCEQLARAPAVGRRSRTPGEVLGGKYKLLRLLGEGGMGAVWAARNLNVGHEVALKVLHSDLARDPDCAKRFLYEAKSYGRVTHPHAVALHDFGADGETLYISMELVEGFDLRHVLRRQGRLALPDAVEVVLQLADVLGFAHDRGVIHRDIKPENVVLRTGGRALHVTLLDFGIARLLGMARITADGVMAGTPRFMSPEQVRGEDIDHRVDIYALGLLTFLLLTGRPAFDAPDAMEVVRLQLQAPLPQLADFVEDRSLAVLEPVLQKATAKDRRDRYASMRDLAKALTTAVPGLARPSHLREPLFIDPADTLSGSRKARPSSDDTTVESSGRLDGPTWVDRSDKPRSE